MVADDVRISVKPIFEYTDYREWIRDAFEDFKKRKTVISWRYMAMKLGADPGNLLRISQGKIHLAVNFIKPMAEFFELDEKESAYWSELVYFGRFKTAACRGTARMRRTVCSGFFHIIQMQHPLSIGITE